MSIKFVVWSTLFGFTFISLLSSFIGFHYPVFHMNENQILYLYSTSAQVLAGTYGLTLTGFIFFRNELSREQIEDESLADAVERLKKRYFYLLGIVTTSTFSAVLLSNVVIAAEGGSNRIPITILLNIAQSAYVISLIVIIYFIHEVVAPGKIERISQQIQRELDTSEVIKTGSLENFLSNFNKMEELLSEYSERYKLVSQSGQILGRRMPTSRVLDFLFRSEVINSQLYKQSKNLVSLRNSLVHGAEPRVSLQMVTTSKDVLNKIESALKKQESP
ncbi:hypothetical protein [Photobacterium leiognathi]|uniref:hypothetical protein n=1 Tax=Photobacterium leiognathi TaxID=553611 RepID=UPI00273467FE|nr:hypothetical protein [Photobacterium leiognathi]